jgi:hypothetical protein
MAVVWDIKEIRTDIDQGITYVHYCASDQETSGSGLEIRIYDGYYDAFVEFNPDPSAEGYTDFANLSKEQVLSWVKSSIGGDMVTTIETAIANQITRAKGSSQTTEMPWTG